ncbi:hypothetical protein scyTo_0023185, partial [Scyliorhinus torazame]|nr:hypothetical protein [Scyliorhinus torazame]
MGPRESWANQALPGCKVNKAPQAPQDLLEYLARQVIPCRVRMASQGFLVSEARKATEEMQDHRSQVLQGEMVREDYQVPLVPQDPQ